MTKVRIRKPIASHDMEQIAGVSPLANASQVLGVRIFDVGQGDAIAVLGLVAGQSAQVLQFDYGGRQGSPFTGSSHIDSRMPVSEGQLLMLSHWDEDHWCSAKKGTVARLAKWLVPRQVTSPRAVLFSAGLKDIHCIPEDLVGQELRFSGATGDHILFEKIGPFAGPFAKDEDCNRTGVAIAVVRSRPDGDEVILLPGDAPFDKVRIFALLAQRNIRLRGIVAFHHGAGTHWTDGTEQLLKAWPKCKSFEVVFSCSDPNSYDHPDEERYKAILPYAIYRSTSEARVAGKQHLEIIF